MDRREAVQERKMLREYDALAATYDQQWSAYLSASLSMTMSMADGLPADRILDVACGTGQLLEMFAKRCSTAELFGIDRVPAMLAVARQRIGQQATLMTGDAAELPFADERFQLVTSTNALHYLTDAGSALQEIRRVIAPSGNLIITDWCRDYFWMRVLNRLLPWTRHAHSHTFSSSELEAALARAGFTVVNKHIAKIDGFWGLMTVHAAPR